MGDIAQHARTERDLVEGHAVAAKRGLRLGAADDIIPRVLVELGSGFADELVQVLEFFVAGAKLDVLPLTHRFLRACWSSCLILWSSPIVSLQAAPSQNGMARIEAAPIAGRTASESAIGRPG